MSNFEAYFKKINLQQVLNRLSSCSQEEVEFVLNKEGALTLQEAATLVSPAAAEKMEKLAVRAHRETLSKFGRTILLYIPLYLSNVCINACCYCGFSSHTEGYTLNFEDVVKEADILHQKGFRHILLVAGDNPSEYFHRLLLRTVEYLRPRFSSISIEIASQSFENYQRLVEAGVDSLTLYQETYHSPTYNRMHPAGPKADYSGRLKAVEDAARAGMRRINLGSLLGLYEWRYEFLALFLHYHYLQKRYWHTSYSLSFPRLRQISRHFTVPNPVEDKDLVHMILAARIAMPETGLVLSTRESPWLRDHLIGLGVTQMSAGSSTQPGGYTSQNEEKGKQFEVADTRSVEEVTEIIRQKGFDPVWKDWEEICYGE